MEAFRLIMMLIISFLMGFILILWPLPDFLHWIRPEWILLLVIFWSLHSENKAGVGVAWFIGLLYDVLSGSLLGEHAMAFAIVSYLIIKTQQRFHLFPYMQQMLIILALLILEKIIVFFIQTSIGQAPVFGLYFLNIMTTLLCWPIVSLVLQRYLQRRKPRNTYLMR